MDDSWKELREELISRVSSNKPSEIEVPPEVYSMCRKLYDTDRFSSSPSRYRYVKQSAAYQLMVHFLRSNLTEDELKREVDVSEKLNRLEQALKALVKYGLNLIGSPNNKLFHRVKVGLIPLPESILYSTCVFCWPGNSTEQGLLLCYNCELC